MTVLARYRLHKADFAAAVASYRKTSDKLGLTVARVFPLLERARISEVDLVILAVAAGSTAAAAGVRPGELLVAINGHLVPGIEAFDAAASAAEGRPLELQLEADGARRTIKLLRP